jgi:hypothetical protein
MRLFLFTSHHAGPGKEIYSAHLIIILSDECPTEGMGVLFRRRSREDDIATTSLLRSGVYRLSDDEDEELKRFHFKSAKSAYSFWSAVKYTFILTFLLWWLPIFGQMIAGYVGGRRAGSPLRAVAAALFPVVVIFLIMAGFDSGLLPSEINGVTIHPRVLLENLGAAVPFFGPYLAFAAQYIESFVGAMQAVTLLKVDNYIVIVAFAYIGGVLADQTRRELVFVAENSRRTNIVIGRDEEEMDDVPIRSRAVTVPRRATAQHYHQLGFEEMKAVGGSRDAEEIEQELPVRTTKRMLAAQAESPRSRREVQAQVKVMEREQKRVEKRIKKGGSMQGLVARSAKARPAHHAKTQEEEPQGASSGGFEYI